MHLKRNEVIKYIPKLLDIEIFVGMNTRRGKIINIVHNGLIDNCTVVHFENGTVFNLFAQNLTDEEFLKNDFDIRCVGYFKELISLS